MRRQRSFEDEEGVSTAMFVIVLFVFLAVAMLAIDGGSLYVSQRGQASDTDAAALAAARLLAEENCATLSSVVTTAERLLENETSLVDGTVELSSPQCSGSGVVTVDTTRDASLYFAPVFGYDRAPTVVRSQAIYGPPDVLRGVRPIAICEEDLHYQEWVTYNDVGTAAYNTAVVATDTAYAAAGSDVVPHPTNSYYPGAEDHVHRITFQRLNADGDPVTGDCSDASGNWGWLDFDSGGNTGYCEDPDTNNELGCRIRQGYEGPISLVARDCNMDSTSITDCVAQTGGAGGSTADDLNEVLCPASKEPSQCDQLMFVVFSADQNNGNNGNGNNGNGNNGNNGNTRYALATVVTAVLRDHDVGTGNPQPDNYIDLEFVDEPLPAEVSGSDPGGTRPSVYQLCGARDFSNCAP